MRQAGEVILKYEFSIASPLAKRDATLKSKNNNWRLASVLSTFSLGENAMMDTRDDGAFGEQEVDITMISYVLEAAYDGKGVIRMLSDDTDMFVLLVYWLYQEELQCKVHMEWWDAKVLDINATCTDLGSKCLQLLGMHALSGCDTTSYPYVKGKISALNSKTLYGQLPGISMESACFTLFTKKKKSQKFMALCTTSTNLLLHVLQTLLQVIWEIKDGIPIPVTDHSTTADIHDSVSV